MHYVFSCVNSHVRIHSTKSRALKFFNLAVAAGKSPLFLLSSSGKLLLNGFGGERAAVGAVDFGRFLMQYQLQAFIYLLHIVGKQRVVGLPEAEHALHDQVADDELAAGQNDRY